MRDFDFCGGCDFWERSWPQHDRDLESASSEKYFSGAIGNGRFPSASQTENGQESGRGRGGGSEEMTGSFVP